MHDKKHDFSQNASYNLGTLIQVLKFLLTGKHLIIITEKVFSKVI